MRLQNANIIALSPEIYEKDNMVVLDFKNTENFINGYIFARYIIVFKDLMRL